MDKLGFIVDDVENCKQEASPGFDTLRIAMSGSAILKTMEYFRIALLSIEGVNNGYVTFGFHGKFSPPIL